MLGSVALLDACVLYPAPLRDFLLRLADAEFYSPRWSPDIHEEWIRNLLEHRTDLSEEKLHRTRDRMNEAFPQALVRGYEARIAGISLPDIGDRHVVAAALQGKATVLVTANLRHFPATVLQPLGIKVVHPDAFTVALYRAIPADLVGMIRAHRAQLTRPPKTASDYLVTLRQNQLTRLVDLLTPHVQEL